MPEAARFYEQLAEEINNACDRQAIPCLPQRTGLLPPFRWHYIGDAVQAAALLGKILLHLGGEDVGRLPSEGSSLAVHLFAETAGPVALSQVTWSIIEAWVGAPGDLPLLTLRGPANPAVRTELLVTAGQAPPSRPGFSVMRMRLITDCPAELCDVVLVTGDGTVSQGKIKELLTRAPIDRPDLFFEVSQVSKHMLTGTGLG